MNGATAEIRVRHKKRYYTVLVSARDAEIANQFRWCLWQKCWRWDNGNVTEYYYVAKKHRIGSRMVTLYLHHLLIGQPVDRKCVIDHKNKNPLDCRRENLRVATRSENVKNSDRQKNSLNQRWKK